MKLKCLLFSALLFPAFSYAQSPATLVGLTHSNYTDSVFTPVDSNWLSYSNGRGSDVKIDAPFYPSLLATPTGAAGMYNYDMWAMGTYDSAHNVMMTGQHTKMYDSANVNRLLSDTYSVPDSSNGFTDVSRVTYSYDSATGNMSAQTSQNMVGNNWVNDWMYTYTYDPANNITSITMMMWNGSNWDNVSKNVYYYNFLNKVTSSLVQTWNAMTSSWKNSEHYIYYSHDNNMTVDSAYYQQMIGTNWVTMSKDIFATDGNGDVVASWHYANNLLSSADSNLYDGMHNKLTQIHMVADTAAMLMNSKQYSWVYNMYGQPITALSATWDSSGLWVFNNTDMMTSYYYSLDSNTAVAQVSNVSNLQLYPVPAQNILNLNISFKQPASFTVAILDMSGRIVRQWNEAETSNFSKTIPVADLASGNYFITIKNSTTNIARQFSVLR